ncbi:MAG: 4-oxalocrotonate tautomerase family protein [Rhodoferax sp.]|nr:4-oxalocrotonate tautomerase family protein [Rhodoferax sp.]
MPVVHLQIVAGLSVEQKRAITQEITRVLTEHAHTKPERTHIIFSDIQPEDWGFEGRLVVDRRNPSPAPIPSP